jgi:hypothetical protein
MLWMQEMYVGFEVLTPVVMGQNAVKSVESQRTIQKKKTVPSSWVNSKAKNSKKKLNSVALVRKRTIPTERPPLSAK